MRQASKTRQSINAEFGRSTAVSALTFLAADAERLNRFLSATGLGPDNLRKAAADPGFYASVLEYVAADEALLLAFAADAGLAPENIARALQSLSGPPPLGEP
jgi:Protein of unknown function (DUF3572)